MGSRRVVITGAGVISAIGRNLSEFRESLSRGVCGIRPITVADTADLRFKNGAEVFGYTHQGHFEEKQATFLDRFAQFAIIAAREAVRDSGIEWNDALRTRTAVVTGSSMGGQRTMDDGFVDLYREKRNRVNPLTIARTMSNAGASHISMEFGLCGPTFTLSTACSSSNHAIGHALWLLRNGAADAAIAGGSEAPFTVGNLKAWEAMRIVAHDTCRPFSKNRRGLVLGEGGGMLMLETLEAAEARGARIYAEIAGFGMSSDAHHLTQPTVEGPARSIRGALDDAGMAPEEVGYINAHGTATPANDPTETAAIRAVFGEHAGRLAISSTKSMHGHALGAAGALEAVATLLALSEGLLPPTVNYEEFDPQCDLDVIPNEPRKAQVAAALSNSFAFGGLNAVLAFRRWDR